MAWTPFLSPEGLGADAVSPAVSNEEHDTTRGDPASSEPKEARFPALAVELEERGSSLIVSLAGELELGTAARFEELLDRLTGGELDDVVIDLRGVSFMDSTGLRMLLTAERIARDEGVGLSVVRGGPGVHRVLQITGMDKVLPLVDDIPEAPG